MDSQITESVNSLSYPDSLSRLNRLREKPSILTDKPYYYPGETIWLTCHMLYQNALLADTLSAVVHIELIQNQRPEILRSFILPILGGVAVGQIELADSLVPGSYSLRAYTYWSRNFGESDDGYRHISVFSIKEKVRARANSDPESTLDILVDIALDKPDYKRREKAVVEIRLKDTFGEPVNGQFTVSITDTLQVASARLPSGLFADFEWLERPPPAEPDSIAYQIEYGISVTGQFTNRKGKPIKAPITIVQGQLENYGVVETDDEGRFSASGLQFVDSAEVAMAAIANNGRPYGQVKLIPVTPPPLNAKNLPPALLEADLTEAPQRYLENDFGKDYVLLDEVVIEKNRQTEKKYWQYGSAPDKTYGLEDLANANASNALNALKNLYSNGSRIITDATNSHYWFCFNSLGAPLAEPVLYIDGVKNLEHRPVGDILFELPVEDVKGIEVFTRATGTHMGRAYTGAVLITTKSGRGLGADNTRIFDSSGFSLYTIKGYHPPQDFPSPDYSEAGLEKPDLRSTLYWNPSLLTDRDTGKARFSFYTADLSTVYRVEVEGVTENNIPFRAVQHITVY